MVAVQIETEPTFVAEESEVLFSAAAFRNSRNEPNYDVDPSGERFIMVRQLDEGASGKVIWVLNFFEELRARVPN
jgi:hypothetical protein